MHSVLCTLRQDKTWSGVSVPTLLRCPLYTCLYLEKGGEDKVWDFV